MRQFTRPCLAKLNKATVDAAAGADLVCAQRQMGRNAGQQKGGNGQKPPPPRYGGQ